MDYLEIIKGFTPWLTGGLGGAALTLVANSWIRRRNRKVLNIEENIHKYSLNFSSSNNMDEDIRITYNSKEYHNLLLYNIKLTNTGKKRIDQSRIILQFPESTDVIESKIKSFPIDIKKEYEITKSIIEGTQRIEYHLLLEKMEANDKISLSFLVNSKEPDKFKLLRPRECDDNLIIKNGQISSINDIESDLKQILYTCAALILFETIPIISIFSNLVQAGIFITMIPCIIRTLNFFFNKESKNKSNMINLYDSNIGDRAVISQK